MDSGSTFARDDDTDPYNSVREWWSGDGHHCATPREDLLAQLGLPGGWGGRLACQAGHLVRVRKFEGWTPWWQARRLPYYVIIAHRAA